MKIDTYVPARLADIRLKLASSVCLIYYSALALAVVAPWLKPGYLLTLDMIFGPRFKIIRGPDISVSSLPFQYLLKTASYAMPTWWLQKLIFFLVFFCSGWLAHRSLPILKSPYRYYAGTLYALNPFVFSRILAGHWLFLISYALAPATLLSIWLWIKTPTPARSLIMAAMLTVTLIIDIHFIFLILFLLVAAPINWLFSKPPSYGKRVFSSGLCAVALLVLLNSFWLLTFATRNSPVALFDQSQPYIFASRSAPGLGPVFNILAMQGFWHRGVAEVKDTMSLWPFAALFIWGLALVGLWSAKRGEQRLLALSAGITALLAVFFALGVSHGLSRDAFLFLYNNLPPFKGFREPQKFVALLVWGYAFLGALGIQNLAERLKPAARASVLAVSFLVVFYSAYPLLWGTHGMLKSTDYPRSWYRVNRLIGAQGDIGLFLPWHLYMKFSFTGGDRVVANPAGVFFDTPIIQSDNPELTDKTRSTRHGARKAEKIILGDRNRLAGRLAEQDINFIILAKVEDWRRFAFLFNNPHFERIYDSDEIALFKNSRFQKPRFRQR